MTKGQPTKNCCSNRWGWENLLFQLTGFLIYTILYNFLPTIIYSIHVWTSEVAESENADRKAENQSNAEQTKNRKRFYEYIGGGHPWMDRLAWHNGSYHEFYCFRQFALSVRVKRPRSQRNTRFSMSLPVLFIVRLIFSCLLVCMHNFQSVAGGWSVEIWCVRDS